MWQNRNLKNLAPEAIIFLQKFNESMSQGNRPETFSEIKSDIFALGVTLFAAIFLREPFENKCAKLDDPLYGLLC